MSDAAAAHMTPTMSVCRNKRGPGMERTTANIDRVVDGIHPVLRVILDRHAYKPPPRSARPRA